MTFSCSGKMLYPTEDRCVICFQKEDEAICLGEEDGRGPLKAQECHRGEKGVDDERNKLVGVDVSSLNGLKGVNPI